MPQPAITNHFFVRGRAALVASAPKIAHGSEGLILTEKFKIVEIPGPWNMSFSHRTVIVLEPRGSNSLSSEFFRRSKIKQDPVRVVQPG
jgi:hypothetical protein